MRSSCFKSMSSHAMSAVKSKFTATTVLQHQAKIQTSVFNFSRMLNLLTLSCDTAALPFVQAKQCLLFACCSDIALKSAHSCQSVEVKEIYR